MTESDGEWQQWLEREIQSWIEQQYLRFPELRDAIRARLQQEPPDPASPA